MFLSKNILHKPPQLRVSAHYLECTRMCLHVGVYVCGCLDRGSADVRLEPQLHAIGRSTTTVYSRLMDMYGNISVAVGAVARAQS